MMCSKLLITIMLLIGAARAPYSPPKMAFSCPEKTQTISPCICLNELSNGLHISCEHTSIASLSIALENLAALHTFVQNITIYKGNLHRLYGPIFYKSKVATLNIFKTPIKSIDEYTFFGINKTLTELHIINSELLEFPAQSFKVLGNLTILNLDGHRIQKLERDDFSDSAMSTNLEKLYLVNGQLNDIPSEALETLRKLKVLDLHGNSIYALKKNQFKNLRDVEVLDLSFNNITKLESQHISDLTKMSWCNLSHNAIKELSRGTFARNSVLKVLNLSFNLIKRLDSNSFRGMRFLRRLYISDNLISDIGRGAFATVSKIGTIDLARNMIKKIDYQMFSQLNYIEIIDVSENNVTEIQKQAFKDLYLTKINISHNHLETIAEFAFQNCVNMTVLDLSHNILKELHNNVFDTTTYATELQLSYNYFTNLAQIPLQNMTGIKVLNVTYNKLELIGKNTFPKLYELHTVDVSYNYIKSISNSVFQTLMSVRQINLSHNSLKEINASVFGSVPTLIRLDMSNNEIQEISRGALIKLISLRSLDLKQNKLETLFEIPISLSHLDLSNNWLQDILQQIWPRMNALLTLDLSGNRLSNNLKSGSFQSLLTLQTLNLNANGIKDVPYESLQSLTNLQYLHLRGNNITILRKAAFGRLPIVFELDLSKNNIFSISPRAFDGLLQLLTLNMSSNSIQNISNEAFFGLVSLKTLDLSHNQIEKLDNKTHGVLDDCLSLESVNISYNKIGFITKKTFPSNPYIPYKLKEIDISSNLISALTYDLAFGTKTVKTFRAANNLIRDIRRGVLRNLTSLEILDLSGNELTNLDEEPNLFALPENIMELFLANNKIYILPLEEISKRKKIHLIDLRQNQMQIFPLLLVERVKQNLIVYFQGNPLTCDCETRPLKHYIMSVTEVPSEYKNLQCVSPTTLAGKTLPAISDDQLACTPDIQYNTQEYNVLPDLRFRQISYSKGKLFLQWYVASKNDVANFYVSVRNSRNKVYREHHLGYYERSIEIDGNDIETAFSEAQDLEVCVVAKNSLGIIERWFESQCVAIPKNFDAIVYQYSSNNNKIYTLLGPNQAVERSNSIASRFKTSLTCEFVIALLIYVLFPKL